MVSDKIVLRGPLSIPLLSTLCNAVWYVKLGKHREMDRVPRLFVDTEESLSPHFLLEVTVTRTQGYGKTRMKIININRVT